ncbi:MAG: ribosome small subunit-dependent GTPase A [Streptosporangiales bacterium]
MATTANGAFCGAGLSALGWNESRVTELAALGDAALRPARVSRVDRGGCLVVAVDGPGRATYGAGALRTAVCTGDWVALRDWPDGHTTVEVVLTRETLVQRLEVSPGGSRSQPLAANVDVVVVVEGAVPDPDLGRIERLLALAWESGAEPLVVLTKADLAGTSIDVLLDDAGAVAPGTEVHAVDAVRGKGIDAIAGHLRTGRTAVLLGASGVGKSSLANALAGYQAMATRTLRADGRGRHTTVARELLALPGGAVLLDTPGLRSIGINVAADAVERVFADITELAGSCRFADCAHDAEPGCGVRAALDDGRLSERRFASWHKLRREAVYQRAKADARLRSERRRQRSDRERETRQARRRARP